MSRIIAVIGTADGGTKMTWDMAATKQRAHVCLTR